MIVLLSGSGIEALSNEPRNLVEKMISVDGFTGTVGEHHGGLGILTF